MKKTTIIWLLFFLVVIFNVLDVYQTYLLVEVGAEETNPIVVYFMDKLGLITGMITVKAIVLSFLAFVLILFTNNKKI